MEREVWRRRAGRKDVIHLSHMTDCAGRVNVAVISPSGEVADVLNRLEVAGPVEPIEPEARS
jgi:hypothetical protein